MSSISSGYEVPQPLQYQEKFFGPVSFVQAGYLTIGLLASVLFYKIGGFNTFPILLILISNAACIGLAFFKLGPKAFSLINYYKTPQKLGYLDKRLGALIGVADVRSDTLFKRDNSKYAILQVKPTNFMIKSEEDKEAIIANFQKFLNSLDHSVQLLARTVNLNLSAYVSNLRENVGRKVKQNKNLKLQRLFEDYCQFVNDKVVNTATKNRLFYVILPAPTGKSAEQLDVLDSRVSVCRDGLAGCGLETRRLNSMQIVSLLSSFFEGFVEVDNDYLFPAVMLKSFKQEKRGKEGAVQ